MEVNLDNSFWHILYFDSYKYDSIQFRSLWIRNFHHVLQLHYRIWVAWHILSRTSGVHYFYRFLSSLVAHQSSLVIPTLCASLPGSSYLSPVELLAILSGIFGRVGMCFYFSHLVLDLFCKGSQIHRKSQFSTFDGSGSVEYGLLYS